MPCYRCGIRQTDPTHGASPWKRGVCHGTQVLICPVCQRGHDWSADLERCTTCGSTMLTRILGETLCRGCGATGDTASASAGETAGALGPVPTDIAGTVTNRPAAATDGRLTRRPPVPGLAEEVEAALERVLRRAPRSTR
jgi:hypothetical protein